MSALAGFWFLLRSFGRCYLWGVAGVMTSLAVSGSDGVRRRRRVIALAGFWLF